MSLNGQWEGKLIDATGVSAIIEAAIKESSGRIDGDFNVYFVSQSSGSCCHVERQLAHSSPIQGRYDGRTRRITIDYKLSLGLEAVSVHLAGTVRDAMPHARQAICGCYRADAGKSDLTLEGGGIVLWQYR